MLFAQTVRVCYTIELQIRRHWLHSLPNNHGQSIETMQHPSKSGLGKVDLVREKRHLEGFHESVPQDAVPENKRQKTPAIASVIVEAVKMDNLQKLCSSLEPILRRVVGEEVERALARLTSSKLESRTPQRQLQELKSSSLRLQFRNKLSLPLFTGGKVEGEQGLPIHVVLEDASTGQVVSMAPESAAKLEVVVLDGDFNNEEEDWTEEDFENSVVKERDGRRPLLTGDLSITLKEGVGTLGELTFTDNSSWIRSRKFRLGVRVASGFSKGVRIQECRTDAFTVKDHRGELYKKHYPPALNDEVWRLDKIGKDGAFHKRLNANHIQTVEDFLRHYVMNKENLRHILGSGMSKKMWESMVEHAKTCILSGKLYVYYADNSHNIGVMFNNIYELMGITSSGSYKPVDSLTENEKVYVDKLVKVAYENWASVMEYDSETLVSEKPCYSETERGMNGGRELNEQLSMYSHQGDSSSDRIHFPNVTTSSAVSSGSGSGSRAQPYDLRLETSSRYTSQDHQLVQSSQMFNIGSETGSQAPTSTPQQNFVSGNEASMTSLALGLSESMMSGAFGFQSVPLPLQASHADSTEWAHEQVKDPLTLAVHVDDSIEEEIREKSVELLKEDEMQQLLRLQYSSVPDLDGEDMYPVSGYVPSPSVNFGEDRSRTSGRAYVGWLKLKAVLRWGIFIRKIAAEKAERRAKLEELKG